jgi:hypothetical protein
VSATRARLIITTVLTNTLRTIVEYQPEVLRECVYLVNMRPLLLTGRSLTCDFR